MGPTITPSVPNMPDLSTTWFDPLTVQITDGLCEHRMEPTEGLDSACFDTEAALVTVSNRDQLSLFEGSMGTVGAVTIAVQQARLRHDLGVCTDTLPGWFELVMHREL